MLYAGSPVWGGASLVAVYAAGRASPARGERVGVLEAHAHPHKPGVDGCLEGPGRGRFACSGATDGNICDAVKPR